MLITHGGRQACRCLSFCPTTVRSRTVPPHPSKEHVEHRPPSDEPLSAGRVIAWWELRRLFQNAAPLIVGVLSLAGMERIMSPALPLGDDALEPTALILGVALYGFAANVCYTLGWILELSGRRYAPAAARTRPIEVPERPSIFLCPDHRSVLVCLLLASLALGRCTSSLASSSTSSRPCARSVAHRPETPAAAFMPLHRQVNWRRREPRLRTPQDPRHEGRPLLDHLGTLDRTHTAGALRADNAARRSSCSAGSTAARPRQPHLPRPARPLRHHPDRAR